MDSQAYWKTLRKETMMTKSVKNIAEITKEILVMNFQIANSKATNPKSKTCLKSNLSRKPLKEQKVCFQRWKTYFVENDKRLIENKEKNISKVEQEVESLVEPRYPSYIADQKKKVFKDAHK